MENIKKSESLLYSTALSFASKKHAGQIRKDGTPYILHPIKVSKLIADAGYGIEYQIAGLFHDLLEDTDSSEEDILSYGKNVLDAVKLVSKNYCTNPKQYVNNILKNHMASVVKNADRIDNLCDCYNSENEAFKKKYLEDSRKYEGKFSKALDFLVLKLENSIAEQPDVKNGLRYDYTSTDLKLYIDLKKENDSL